LTQGGVQWQIANRGFDPNRIDVAPRLGSTELWQWHNPSNRVHPMHLHGMLYRIVERSTGVVHPGDRGWKDTVAVYAHQTVVIRPYFDYFTGVYVFHCHAAEHGDMSMMGQMQVVA
jgi:FtsP/CotA-like multicopper oxidase with cupredoxin domain